MAKMYCIAAVILASVSAVGADEVRAFAGQCHALVIGIGSYQDTEFRSAEWAARDAQAVYDTLSNPAYGRCRDNAVLLVDASATRQNIVGRMEELAADAGEEDTVVLFFSSHGLQDDQGHWYWAAHDTQLDRESVRARTPLPVGDTALDEDTVLRLLNAITAQRCILFLDCGFSPAAALRVKRGVTDVVPSRTTRVVDPVAALQGGGRIIVTGSAGDSRSQKLPDKENGALGFCLWQALRGAADQNSDNLVEVMELWGYLEQELPKLSETTGIAQQPTISATRLAARFPLTTYPMLLMAGTGAVDHPAVPVVPEASVPLSAQPEEPRVPAAVTMAKPETQPKEQQQIALETDEPLEVVRVEVDTGKTLWVAAHEVTNAEYAAFLEANPQWRGGGIDPRYHDGDYLKHWTGASYPEGQDGLPVVYVSWFAAKAYAEWQGGRLLTETEWEAVARGADQRIYPWGDTWEPGRCNSAESNLGALAQPASRPAGASTWPDGKVFDLAGNAWEWCDDVYYQYTPANPEEYSIGRAVKGGSFRAGQLGCMVEARIVADPRLCSDDGGIRVAFARESLEPRGVKAK